MFITAVITILPAFKSRYSNYISPTVSKHFILLVLNARYGSWSCQWLQCPHNGQRRAL